MRTLRPAAARGHADHGWLDTHHTFSFADYYDPKHMGFRGLRVINEDRVSGGTGFGTHPHRDMEIVTVVLSGRLRHRDSMGNGADIAPGDVQRMTAGRGLTHSEFNPDPKEPVHLYQIWIKPHTAGLEPGWEQKHFAETERHNELRLVASPDGRDGSVVIRADAELRLGTLDAGHTVTHAPAAGRHAWVQVLRGRVDVDGTAMKAGDGLAVSDEAVLNLRAEERAEVLLFDLA